MGGVRKSVGTVKKGVWCREGAELGKNGFNRKGEVRGKGGVQATKAEA